MDIGRLSADGATRRGGLPRLRERHRFIRGHDGVGRLPPDGRSVRPPAADARRDEVARCGRCSASRVDALTSFSHVPLQLATWLGFVVSAFSFLYIVVVLVLKIRGVNVTGWTTLMFFILFLGGVQLIVVGVLGEYVGRIYEEVKRRPLYLVARGWWGGPGENLPPAHALSPARRLAGISRRRAPALPRLAEASARLKTRRAGG